jgi:hypothetical protein
MFVRPSWGGSLVLTWKAGLRKANAKAVDRRAAGLSAGV